MKKKPIKIPRYEQVRPDLLLIGIRHEQIKFRERIFQTRKFVKVLGGLDHLAFEGESYVHGLNKEMGVLSYEQIAYNSFSGHKYFLDDNSDLSYVDLLEEKGVSTDLFGIYKLFLVIPNLLSECPSLDGFLEQVKKYLEFGQKIYPGMNQVSIPNVVNIMRHLIVDLLENYEQVGEISYLAATKFQTYLAILRDHEVYYPKIKKMSSDLDGQKGVVFGESHVDSIKKLLSDDTPSNLPKWEKYLLDLDEEAQKGIKFIEDSVKRAKE